MLAREITIKVVKKQKLFFVTGDELNIIPFHYYIITRIDSAVTALLSLHYK
jgi:hypothetical protein